jgi:hypothetical protein
MASITEIVCLIASLLMLITIGALNASASMDVRKTDNAPSDWATADKFLISSAVISIVSGISIIVGLSYLFYKKIGTSVSYVMIAFGVSIALTILAIVLSSIAAVHLKKGNDTIVSRNTCVKTDYSSPYSKTISAVLTGVFLTLMLVIGILVVRNSNITDNIKAKADDMIAKTKSLFRQGKLSEDVIDSLSTAAKTD